MTTILDIPESNPPNPFSKPLQALLATNNLSSVPKSALVVDNTVDHIVTSIATSSDPAHTLWELWDAFLTAVVTSTSHGHHLSLLNALRAQPPTQLTNVRAGSIKELPLRDYIKADGKLHWQVLPRFDAQWHDVHDILEAWRDWDGVREPNAQIKFTASVLNNSGGEYFLRFCSFSAALLKATKGKGGVHPVWVFYACRDALEREEPHPCQSIAHRIPPEQVWALDVRVAAIWVRDGGRALWEMDYDELRRHWAAALDDKTELWPREDGLTRERWQLWGKRLLDFRKEEGILDEETRAVVTEAADVIRGILEEDSTWGVELLGDAAHG